MENFLESNKKERKNCFVSILTRTQHLQSLSATHASAASDFGTWDFRCFNPPPQRKKKCEGEKKKRWAFWLHPLNLRFPNQTTESRVAQKKMASIFYNFKRKKVNLWCWLSIGPAWSVDVYHPGQLWVQNNILYKCVGQGLMPTWLLFMCKKVANKLLQL